MTRVAAKIAILTGAGTGIGRELAQLLAGAGYGLSLVGRRREKLDEVVSLLGDDADTLPVTADVTEPDAAAAIVDATLERWERVDVLVNNAGGVELAPLAATGHDVVERMFAVNAFGPLRLIARLWDVFVRQRGGAVINISSMATIDPFPGLSAYAAAKAALESLTRSIVTEGRAVGLRAWSIAPGAVETPMLRGLWSHDDLPARKTLAPSAVAHVAMDCIEGRRDAEIGKTIVLPSP